MWYTRSMQSASAIAHPNIAFIKYWGNTNDDLRIPANGSISMNLDGLFTTTSVTFDPTFSEDSFVLNSQSITGAPLQRVVHFLENIRQMAGISEKAQITSDNNFPTGAGIASSASAFAALAVASSHAANLELTERELSRLARTGSGSACRSVPTGFVEWQAGVDHNSSYAYSIASSTHWDLVDCIAIVAREHKITGSTAGHSLAKSSLLQVTRITDTPRRLDICRQAILNCDFEAFADITELESNLMHAIMLTSTPRLMYWEPATIGIMQSVQSWRNSGLPVCYTIDAGPNVHVLTLSTYVSQISKLLAEHPGVYEVLTAKTGGAAQLII